MPQDLPISAVAEICRRFAVAELVLFGSALDSDFDANSDYDFMVTFLPQARVSLFQFAALQAALSDALGREVDLVSRRALRNPYFTAQALSRTEVVYAAG